MLSSSVAILSDRSSTKIRNATSHDGHRKGIADRVPRVIQVRSWQEDSGCPGIPQVEANKPPNSPPCRSCDLLRSQLASQVFEETELISYKRQPSPPPSMHRQILMPTEPQLIILYPQIIPSNLLGNFLLPLELSFNPTGYSRQATFPDRITASWNVRLI